MKLNQYFLMTAAAMTLFACSNDENEGLNKGKGNMTMITLSLGEAKGRAVSETAGEKYNHVKDLRLEFFTADGRNLNVPQPADLTDAISELSTAHQTKIAVENVPLTARKIAVIANEKDIINTGSLDNALKSTVKLENMYDDDATLAFNQQNSVLTGQADVPSGSDGTTVNVNIEIKPVSSRLEIGKFTAKKEQTPGEGQTAINIKNFDVKGIFINQFYTVGALDPTKNAADRLKVAHGSTVNNYSAAHYAQCAITEGGEEHDFSFMCDDYENGYGEPAVAGGKPSTAENAIWEVAPTIANRYWGYPVLAGDEKETNGIYDVANIVIKLAVSYDTDADDATPRTKYITVVGYKKTDGSKVTKFTRSEVYRIENFEFDINDLTDVPYEGNKTVNAIVKVSPWTAQGVTPDIQ